MIVILIVPIIYMMLKHKKYSYIYLVSIAYILYDTYKIHLYSNFYVPSLVVVLVNIIPMIIVLCIFFISRNRFSLIFGALYMVIHISILILNLVYKVEIEGIEPNQIINFFETFSIIITVLRYVRLAVFEIFIILFYNSNSKAIKETNNTPDGSVCSDES